MDEQKLIEKIVREIISSMENSSNPGQATILEASTNRNSRKKLTKDDYPLASKKPELIRTPTNKGIDEITLQAVLDGKITAQDVRITGETLNLQAEIAESVGRVAFAGNLKRAAEMTVIPDDRILEIYNAMRPYRSTKKQLIAIAEEIETKYKAVTVGSMIREAADSYEIRNRLLTE